MARIRDDNLNQKEGFSKTLFLLCMERGIDSSPKLASELYTGEIAEIIKPGRRKSRDGKYYDDYKHAIEAITRTIQRHFSEVNPWKVQSEYMYAYSLFFSCSLDYLYGKTDIRTPEFSVRSFCEQSGLSEGAVNNLLCGEKVYLGDFLFEGKYNNQYAGPDLYVRISSFWDSVLSAELYKNLPSKWYELACASFFYESSKDTRSHLEKHSKSLPPRDEFIDYFLEEAERGGTWFSKGLSLGEVYDTDQPQALSMWRDLCNKLCYANEEDIKSREYAFLGASGKFDRYLEGWFHQQASEFKLPDPDPDDEW